MEKVWVTCSVHHEENDNDKEQGCQNEELQSHSPEQREIMEPVFVLEEQLYSPNISRLWRSGACISYYEAKEDDEEFDVNSTVADFGNVVMHSFIVIYSLQNAELDLQQEEYALSKDIDVSLWIDFREFYGNFPLQEVLGGNFVVVNENLHAEFAEFKGKVLSYIETTHCLVKGIELLISRNRRTSDLHTFRFGNFVLDILQESYPVSIFESELF